MSQRLTGEFTPKYIIPFRYNREKAESAKEVVKDVVSKGIDAAKDVVKAVPLPGRER